MQQSEMNRESNEPFAEDNPKHILLTGGTEGIGKEIVDRFAGFDPQLNFVITCSRNETANRSLERAHEGNVQSATMDLGDELAVEQLVREARLHSIDTLILNAAVTGIPLIDTQTYPERYIQQVNEHTPLKLVRELLPELRTRKGFVLFTSSPMATADFVPQEAKQYAATKKAVETAIQKLAREEDNEEVTFLVIRPGSVRTRIHERVLSDAPHESELYQRSAKLQEQGRLRDPRVIGNILYTITDRHALFNPSSGKYDQPVVSGAIHNISDEEYETMRATMKG